MTYLMGLLILFNLPYRNQRSGVVNKLIYGVAGSKSKTKNDKLQQKEAIPPEIYEIMNQRASNLENYVASHEREYQVYYLIITLKFRYACI